MPDYKKKRKHYKPIKKSRYNNDYDDIKMRSEKARRVKSTSNSEVITPPRLIKGKKQKRIARAKVITVFIAIVLIVFAILKLMFPIGVFETLQHFIKTLGVGDYPIEIADNEVIDVSCQPNNYCILTRARVYNVTENGKVISDFTHGFNDPVLKTCKTRYLVFGQGEKDYSIYVNGEKKISNSYDDGIICADISDSGVFAIAGYSKTYASTVTVYNSAGKKIFNWNSAADIINSVAVSENGKKIAVSTINTKGGKKFSKLHIFNFNNTDAESTITIDDDFVYNLSVNKKGFFAIMKNSFTFIDWNKKEQTTEKSEYSVKFFKAFSSNTVAVYTREDSNYDNTVYLLANNGKIINKFNYSGTIKDISLDGKRVFIYGDGKVKLFDSSGQSLGTVTCDDLGRKIVATDSGRFSLISDDAINSIEINK